MELCDVCLRLSSSLSEPSGVTQVHGDWHIIEVSGHVRGVVPLEAVLVIPLLPLFWDKSSHLVIVSFPKNLTDGLLGYHAVDSSLF